MRFRTTVDLHGKTATGMQVPDEVVDGLGGGARPAVTVTVNGHIYRSTIARRGTSYLLPLSAENRTAARVAAGDEIDVDVELDTQERVVDVPEDLAAALRAKPEAQARFDALAFTHRKEWVRWATDAKRPETRERRVAETVRKLGEGLRTFDGRP